MPLRWLLPLTALAVVSLRAQPVPPVRILLVGDSTVALHNGWGPGFCALLAPEVTCGNLARNGRSSASYRTEGSWDKVLEELQQKAGFAETYVLIQFGHNDQPGKPGRSTDLATEFPANLARYVRDVRAAGARPILVTPLTRRTFRAGQVNDTLGPWADAAKRVAAEEGIPVLDLHADSLAAVQQMGPVAANTLAMAPPPDVIAQNAASGDSLPAPKSPDATGPVFDYTHLGPKGSAFFGRMVARELAAAVPALQPYLHP